MFYPDSASGREPYVLSIRQGGDVSEAQQILVSRDQRQIKYFSRGRQETISGIKMWELQLLCDQHDLVRQRSLA